MKIFVKVKASSKNEGVTKVDELHYIVSVKAPPVEGKANEAIGKVLSDYFKVPKSHITILKGGHSKNKIIEISSYSTSSHSSQQKTIDSKKNTLLK